MITKFRVQNYKALRDVTLELTPVHVLIGPNDSGKTSLLEALGAVCRSADSSLFSAFRGSWQGRELVWNGQDSAITITVSANISGTVISYRLACEFAEEARIVSVSDEVIETTDDRFGLPKCGANYSSLARTPELGLSSPYDDKKRLASALTFREELRSVQDYRFEPSHLALPVVLDSRRRFRMSNTGFGLAQCLDDILGADRQRFTELERRFCDFFPQFASIKLVVKSAFMDNTRDDSCDAPIFARSEGKGIEFGFRDGAKSIAASHVSDGVLLVLAFLTLRYLPQPPHLLLIEEPENGIHPKRLEDVIAIFQEIIAEQSDTQVVMTTHSPYVLDMFSPSEVSLCRKEDDGSVTVHRLSESELVRKQLDVFTLGEIWTAEGDDALIGTAEAAS